MNSDSLNILNDFIITPVSLPESGDMLWIEMTVFYVGLKNLVTTRILTIDVEQVKPDN